ncbi:MAG: SDR family NAD(P)-dependent oxidoreductase [Hyphomicrobiales bacterium]
MRNRPVLVTGGCGFIGCNIADALASRGDSVIAYDSFARPGSEENAHWLKVRHGERVEIIRADIRDPDKIEPAVAQASGVIHLAAQVAVTTSVENPLDDFAVNMAGTLNILECVRRSNPEAPLIFASTNKVYGKLLGSAEVTRKGDRYVPLDDSLETGVSERARLDFYSPYGCSKGAADQYVRDYARIYGLRTAVLRMSCIYGPRQFGNEDQGWVAHFMIQAIQGNPITIYGDGCQVRDILHVSDAVKAWLSTLDHIDEVTGSVFNLGGGPENTVSLLEAIEAISDIVGERPRLTFDGWRPGDQPWYVSDIRTISFGSGWTPRIPVADGMRDLHRWLAARFGNAAKPAAYEEARA